MARDKVLPHARVHIVGHKYASCARRCAVMRGSRNTRYPGATRKTPDLSATRVVHTQLSLRTNAPAYLAHTIRRVWYYDNLGAGVCELNGNSLCALNVNLTVRNACSHTHRSTHCELGFRSMYESRWAADLVPATGNTTYLYDKRKIEIMRVRNINVDILISILVILSTQGLIRWSANHRIN